MSLFQNKFSITYKHKFLGRESNYYTKTAEYLDDEERIVAQTEKSVI